MFHAADLTVGSRFQISIRRRLASGGWAVLLPYPRHASSSRCDRRPPPQYRSGPKVVQEETTNQPPPPDVSSTSSVMSRLRRPSAVLCPCHLTCSRHCPASVSSAMSLPASAATSPCHTRYPPNDVMLTSS